MIRVLWSLIRQSRLEAGLAGMLLLCSPIAAQAQTVPAPADKPSPQALDSGPIEGGKHLQPKGAPTQSGAADADQLLRAGAQSPAVNRPPVVPRDLYGQPMGREPWADAAGPRSPPRDDAAA